LVVCPTKESLASVGRAGMVRLKSALDVRALTTNDSSFASFAVLCNDTELSIFPFVVSSTTEGWAEEPAVLVRFASTRMAPFVVCRKMLDVALYEPMIWPFVVVRTVEPLFTEPKILALVVETVVLSATTD
jgi:hypothetical protein